MKCPLCSENLDHLDEPDNAMRGYCCPCGVMVAVYELSSPDEICHELDEGEDLDENELLELKKLVEEEDKD